jgi:hypothetical protein
MTRAQLAAELGADLVDDALRHPAPTLLLSDLRGFRDALDARVYLLALPTDRSAGVLRAIHDEDDEDDES